MSCTLQMEECLIAHCSPTLASLKPASLFRMPCNSASELAQAMLHGRSLVSQKGVSLFVLQYNRTSALVYACRKSMLERTLALPCVSAFLQPLGYCPNNVDACIAHLASRIQKSGSFPHEIGLFLGYPFEDVLGFIRTGGKDCKCTGYWKVYGDEAAAKKTFEKFDHCKQVYNRCFRQGRGISQLTVAV